MLRIRLDGTILTYIHKLSEKKNQDMSKVIRTLIKSEYFKEFTK
jgi:hypothetical protein